MGDDRDPLTNVERAHVRAMEAKRTVFLAQDFLSRAWSDHAEGRPGAAPAIVLRRLERRLAKARVELEQADNAFLHWRKRL